MATMVAHRGECRPPWKQIQRERGSGLRGAPPSGESRQRRSCVRETENSRSLGSGARGHGRGEFATVPPPPRLPTLEYKSFSVLLYSLDPGDPEVTQLVKSLPWRKACDGGVSVSSSLG